MICALQNSVAVTWNKKFYTTNVKWLFKKHIRYKRNCFARYYLSMICKDFYGSYQPKPWLFLLRSKTFGKTEKTTWTFILVLHACISIIVPCHKKLLSFFFPYYIQIKRFPWIFLMYISAAEEVEADHTHKVMTTPIQCMEFQVYLRSVFCFPRRCSSHSQLCH